MKKIIKTIERHNNRKNMICAITTFLKDEEMTNQVDSNILNTAVSCNSHLRPDN